MAAALALTLAAVALAGDVTRRLSKGEVLCYERKKKGSEIPELVTKAVIDQPPAKVWKLIRDCNRYSNTMPRIKASRLLRRSGNKYVCKTTADMPFPYSDTTSVTEAIHTEKDGVYTRRWRLLSGDYKVNSGAWVLKPFNGDARRTLVTYRIHAAPKAWVPGWIRTAAQKRTLPKMINRLRVILR